MTESQGPPHVQSVADHLKVLSRELDDAVEKLRQLDRERIGAEGDYKTAFARAFRESPGSMEARKQEAVLACDRLWRIWSLAESAVKMQQAHLKAIHARIDVGRSIYSSQKSEHSLIHSSGYGP